MVPMLSLLVTVLIGGQAKPLPFAKETETVLKSLRMPTSATLEKLCGPSGLTVNYLDPSNRIDLSYAILPQLMKANKSIRWSKPTEGDGGMRPAYRNTLRGFLTEIGANDWSKNTVRAAGMSPTPTYRTLFIQDIAKDFKGVTFIDLNKRDPKVSEMKEFSKALILGFDRSGKLRVLGYDAWKD